MRTFFILVAAVAVGYWYGFRDARKHEMPLYRRAVGQIADKAGGASRSRVSNDLDERARKLER